MELLWDIQKIDQMDKRILIIGGLGFIGKNLYEDLKRSQYKEVDILSFEPLKTDDPFSTCFTNKLFIGSIEDSNLLENLIPKYDIIYSLAGLSGASMSFNNPINDININLKGHINILQACVKSQKRIKIIFPSSRLVYGKPQYLPVEENHPIRPQSIYAIHKYTVEHYYQLYSEFFNIDSIILRISNPYGPYQSFENHNYGILNRFIYTALTNKTIKIYGRGQQKRDFIFIKDLTDIMIQCITSNDLSNKIFNIGAPDAIKLIEAVEIIKEYIPKLAYENVPWPEIDKKIETGDYLSDISKIRKVTGWEPKTDLKTGLKGTIDFYKRNKDFYGKG